MDAARTGWKTDTEINIHRHHCLNRDTDADRHERIMLISESADTNGTQSQIVQAIQVNSSE